MSKLVEKMARGICKSRSCLGVSCCEWPSNAGERHKCTAEVGYADAARAALAVVMAEMRESIEKQSGEYERTWARLWLAQLVSENTRG